MPLEAKMSLTPLQRVELDLHLMDQLLHGYTILVGRRLEASGLEEYGVPPEEISLVTKMTAMRDRLVNRQKTLKLKESIGKSGSPS